MSVYLVIVALLLPGDQSQELTRVWTTASSASVCQRHADKLADEQRQLHADTVRRLGAKVSGACVFQGALT